MRYYVFHDGQTTGPHEIEVLRELAATYRLVATSPVAVEGASEWTAAGAIPEIAAFLPRPGSSTVDINASSSKPPIQMEDILKDNLARQLAVEKPVDLTPRSNLRLKHYLVTLIAGNLFGGLLVWIVPWSPYTIPYLIAYFCLFNSGLYWVVFQVMDRY